MDVRGLHCLQSHLRLGSFVLAGLLFIAAGSIAQSPTDTKATPAPLEVLFEEIEQLRSEHRELSARYEHLEGEEQAVVGLQASRRLLEFIRKMEALVGGVLELDESDPDTRDFRDQTRVLVLELDGRIDPFVHRLEVELSELRKARDSASDEELSGLDERIASVEHDIDESLRYFGNHIGYLASFGLPADAARKHLTNRLDGRAKSLAGRLDLARKRLGETRKASRESPGDTLREAEVRASTEQRDAAAESLRTTCDVMDGAGMETADYRQLLIEATGEITSDVFNFEVARGLLEEARAAAGRWLERSGPGLLSQLGIFLFILAVFWAIGAVTRRAVARVLNRADANVSELSRRILVATASRFMIGIGFFVALSQIGVNVTALLTGLGIAGFIVGFALQETLGNFASGAMILMYRPYDVGDVIEAASIMGTVDSMNLVSTTILTFDHQTLVVPNSRIWGDVIRNVTSQNTRRVDLKFGLALDTDIERAEALFASVLAEHPHVLEDPAPAIRVHGLSDSAIEFIVRPWVETANYWATYWDLNREIKLQLDRAGIRLGVPRREVQIHAADA